MKKILKIVAIATVLFSTMLIFGTGALWILESSLIFRPKPYPVGNWAPGNPHPSDIWFTTPDGTKLNGWYLPHEKQKAVILYLHGNVGNITDHYDELVKLHDCNFASVMTFDYRGFGRSIGHPTEEGIRQDAMAAQAWLAQKAEVSPQNIILLGRSLGSGVAVDLASRNKIKGLILISPFLSLPDTVQYHYPILPARWVMHNQFNSKQKIASHKGPLLVIHGDADATVPLKHGLKLFDLANQPKRFFRAQGRNHFDPISEESYQQITKFVEIINYVRPITDLKPTVILISIDGFRADYLDKLPVQNLTSIARQGVRAKALTPVFPSVTFPNHFSIATGLYPEHHGIMLNEFLDRTIPEPFTHVGHAPHVTDPRWWQGEPIWVTAEKQGKRSASAFWPGSGSKIQGILPTYYQSFEEDGNPEDRVNQILSWLDLPPNQRPQLLTLYFENVDNGGHQAGPLSKEVQSAAIHIDQALGKLLQGLKERKIDSLVNLIIVSDHGMSKVDPKKIIDLTKIAHFDDIETITGEGAIVGVYPKPDKLSSVYRALKQTKTPMRVYGANEIPDELHYRNHRTPPILCIAKEHAYILGKDRKIQGGTHGYDHKLASMGGIFLAMGPAFKTKYQRASFQNIHIYSLISRILNLNPSKNDGSIEQVKDVLR